MDPFEHPDFLDPENPYAPPQSAPAVAVTGLPFTVHDVFNWSWAIFSEKMRTCLSIFWGVAGIRLLANIVLKVMQDELAAGVRDEYLFKIAWILALFLTYVCLFWLEIGLAIAMIKIARDEPISFEDVFSGGRYLLTVILAWILRTILLAVPIAAAVGVILGYVFIMENQSGVAAFLVFLVASGIAGLVFIFLAARFSLFFYLVIDRDAGVFESLLESWRLSRNLVGTITLVYAVEFAVILAGVLALCVGIIFALPLMSLIDVVMYLAIVTGASSSIDKPPFSLGENVEQTAT